jgi:hypothetical protein
MRIQPGSPVQPPALTGNTPEARAHFSLIAAKAGGLARTGLAVEFPIGFNRLTFASYECNGAALTVARKIRKQFAVSPDVIHLQIPYPISRLPGASTTAQNYSHYVVDASDLLKLHPCLEAHLEAQQMLLHHRDKTYIDVTPLGVRESEIHSSEPFPDGPDHAQFYPLVFSARSVLTWPSGDGGFALDVSVEPPGFDKPLLIVLSGNLIQQGTYSGDGFCFSFPIYQDQWSDMCQSVRTSGSVARLDYYVSGQDHAPILDMVSSGKLAGRNDPCPCGSGMKYKKCHGAS